MSTVYGRWAQTQTAAPARAVGRQQQQQQQVVESKNEESLTIFTQGIPLTRDITTTTPVGGSPGSPQGNVVIESGPPMTEEGPARYSQLGAWGNHAFEGGPRKCPEPPEHTIDFDTDMNPHGKWYIYAADLADPFPARNSKTLAVEKDEPPTWGLLLPVDREVPEGAVVEEVTVAGETLSLLQLNPKKSDKDTWVNRLDKDCARWDCVFPFTEISSVFRPCEVCDMDLHFALNNTTPGFMAAIQSRFEVELTSPPTATLLAVANRIVPLSMHIVSESGQLPVDCDVQLCSFVAESTGRRRRRQWFNTGVVNPSPNPTPGLLRLAHVVRGGQAINTKGDEVRFQCSPEVVRPEFMRWARTNFDAVLALLDAPPTFQLSKTTRRFIKGMTPSQEHPDNVLQFMCLNEWSRLVAQSVLRKAEGVKPCSVDLMKESDEYRFEVDAGVMKQLVDEKRAAVNAERNVMDLKNGVTLWLRSIHATNPKPMTDNPTTAYQCVVRVRYCVLS